MEFNLWHVEQVPWGINIQFAIAHNCLELKDESRVFEIFSRWTHDALKHRIYIFYSFICLFVFGEQCAR